VFWVALQSDRKLTEVGKPSTRFFCIQRRCWLRSTQVVMLDPFVLVIGIVEQISRASKRKRPIFRRASKILTRLFCFAAMALNSCSLSSKEKPASGGFFANRCESRLKRMVDTKCELSPLALRSSALEFISTVHRVQGRPLAQHLP